MSDRFKALGNPIKIVARGGAFLGVMFVPDGIVEKLSKNGFAVVTLMKHPPIAAWGDYRGEFPDPGVIYQAEFSLLPGGGVVLFGREPFEVNDYEGFAFIPVFHG